MTGRAHEADSRQFALWNRKRLRKPCESRRVLVADADEAVGESLVLLLSLKGFSAQRALHVSAVKNVLQTWNPQVMFIDTRIGGCGNYALARELCAHDQAEKRLVIAMSNFLPQEPSICSGKRATTDTAAGHAPCGAWPTCSTVISHWIAASRQGAPSSARPDPDAAQ